MNMNLKTIGLISLLFALLFIAVNVLANVRAERIKINVSQACEEKIEEAVKKIEGVLGANWDDETKELEIIFKTDKISFDDIEQAISKAGFNTPNYKASNEGGNTISKECENKQAFTKEQE